MAKKILVVDDEVRVLTVIQKRLQSAGYEVITATNGRDGLKLARAENPDLVILDLILPGMGGYEVCSFLKRDKRFSHIPVIILTARSQEKDIEEGNRAGADAYFTKPFNPEELIKKIEELLAGKK